MKLNFRKITAIATSALMVGMTMGSAIALAPSDKAFDAVVYGTAADASDKTQAESISTWLGLKASSTGGNLSGTGDSYQIGEDDFQLGLGISSVKTTAVSADNLPKLLADGTYLDNDNDEFEFTQKINVNNHTLRLWEDSEYADNVPTLGFKITSGTNVMNYTLTFADDPYFNDLETTDMTIMGKTYYVLDVNSANTTITLLDSANTVLLTEGETQTVNGKTVSVEYIGSASVKLNVDGEITNSLASGETYKLKDNTYVGIKEILYNSKDTGVSQVEFSIGSGKLVLESGTNVEMNGEDVEGITATIGGTTQLSTLTLKWDAEDDLFVTPTSEITMPGFEAVKLSFTGLNFPKQEVINIEGGAYIRLTDFPLKSGNVDIPVAFWNDTKHWFDAIGKSREANEVLLSTNATNITMDWDTERQFIVSWSDGNDAESYLMKISEPNSANETTFSYATGDGTWNEAQTVTTGDDFTVGEVEITLGTVSGSANTVNFWRGNSNMNFNTLYTKEGMKVFMPWKGANLVNITNSSDIKDDLLACGYIRDDARELQTAIAYNKTGALTVSTAATCARHDLVLIFSEEDETDNIGAGENISVTLNQTTTAADDEADVASYALTSGYSTSGTGIEDGSSDKFVNYVYSALATKVVWDKTDDPESLELTYHGSESTGDVYITSSGVSAIGSTGNMVFTDAEKTAWQAYNVILVGGSCINTATATALGVAPNTCTDAWTAATLIGDGKYLIQSVGNAFTTGKTALIVAGYSKDNTVAAATKLRTNGASINTTAGNKYVGVVGVGLDSTISKV